MKMLLLVEGLSYMYNSPTLGRIIHFQRDIPKLVDDGLVRDLLLTGKFEEVSPEEVRAIENVDMTVKFSGSIGDAVVTANCVAALRSSLNGNFRIICKINGNYRPVAQLIAKGIEFRRLHTPGRGRKHVNLEVAPRSGGEGFAWETGIASALGFDEYPEPPDKFEFRHRDLQKVGTILRRRKREKLAIMHMWSGHSRSKSYQPEKVGILINALQDDGYDVVVLGLQDEPNYEADIIDVRGLCSIVESAAVMSQADLVISVDSWVWHMAKLMFIPQVVLFGSLRPEGRPRPWETVRVLRGELCEGRDCNTYSCQNSQCIDSIELNDVMDAVEEVELEARMKPERQKPECFDREKMSGVKW